MSEKNQGQKSRVSVPLRNVKEEKRICVNIVKIIEKYRGSKTYSTQPINAECHSFLFSYWNLFDFY